MNIEEFAEREVEIAKKGRVARVLDSYAKSIEVQKITCVDSDLPYMLRQAAQLLRVYCLEVKQYEERMRMLGRMD